ncbi:zinc finger protein 771-like [Dunckerocampus dactyliophorus]|uniref:zinc finger protein 771-like n=1 Tax=Dunckerocampus dactyliophorus TaxID=161453 RepID=UPI002405222F|nr:zinc finger protein 771-like [Dunckerocampus dactyliophorus]
MVKELVKERLMAAADEISAMFERTIASYEEELSRTREEKERLRQQLEAVSKTGVLVQLGDVQQLFGHQEQHSPQPKEGGSILKQEGPQPPHIKDKEEELWITQEAELTKLPPTGVSVTEDQEDKPPESSCLLHPSDVQQMIDRQEQLQGGSSILKQPPHVKEEEQELWISQEEEETDPTELPLTGVSVKTEGHEDKLLAPLSVGDDVTSHYPEDEDRDHTQVAVSSDTGGEGDVRTHADNKHSEFCEKKTGKNRFACSVCAKSFFFKSRLTEHMRKHTGQKPFSCSFCGRTFASRSALMQHTRTHSGEKPFSCSVCDSKFALRCALVQHMRTHTGEKPFSCSVCGKGFSHRCNMTTHMRTHTGEKPFSCSLCGQRFPRRSGMASHMRSHTGEKPFGCSVCGKRISTRSNMVDHMRTHRREKARPEGLGSASDKNKLADDDDVTSTSSQPKHYWNQKDFEWSF